MSIQIYPPTRKGAPRRSAPLRILVGLALLALALACGDRGTGPELGPKVAAVVLTGVPVDTVEVGASIQLTATPVDAQGEPIPDAPVTWVSSDKTIATVDEAGLVRTQRTGDVVIVATSDQQSTTATIHVGVLRTAKVEISGVPTSPLTVGDTARLSAVTYSRTGAVLTNRAVTWSSGAPGVAQVDGTGLIHAMAEGSATVWATSDGVADTAAFMVIDVVAMVRVTPSSFVIYGGQQRQLAAAGYDPLGNQVTGRTVTWTSLNPTRATVDADGLVTGLDSGAVSIRATIEEASATASARVLTRPMEDWAGAEGWVTHQGNPRHTGYVPVTVDPVVFDSLWTTTVLAGSELNPVTEGAGQIYVSTVGYFDGNVLTALDAATGSQNWSYDFGEIHGVHPPAFGNDRVYVTTSGHENSYLWAFDPANGSIVGRAAYGNQWSRYFAPVVLGGAVYMAGGYYDGMYAFDATSLEERWFAATNQYDQWTPAVADGKVYAYTGEYSPKVLVVDTAAGQTVDSIPDPNFSWEGWSMHISPVLGGMHDLLATQGHRLISFDLQAGTVGWQESSQFLGNVTVAKGVLYVFNGNQVEARSESDGSLLWLWVPPAGALYGTMIATNNVLFVSTNAATYAIDLASHLNAWSFPAGGHLALTRDGVLVIARPDGRVSAVQLKGL